MTISRAGFLATEEAPHGTRVYNEENENVGSGETKRKKKNLASIGVLAYFQQYLQRLRNLQVFTLHSRIARNQMQAKF